MVYDAADGYVVGVTPQLDLNLTTPTLSTWKFSAGNWSLINATGSPPSRFRSSLVYDSRLQAVVLFGGTSVGSVNGSGWYTPLNDTWTYHAGVWAQMATRSAPPPRELAFFVDDVYDGYDILFGGTNGFRNGTTTWALSSSGWSNLSLTGPTPYLWGGATYDAADHYVLYFGGLPPTSGSVDSTWTFHGGAWTNVTNRTHGTPSSRGGASLAYDTRLGKVLMFGGDQSSPRPPPLYGLLNDSYVYVAGNWSPSKPTSAPTPRASAALVYDAADNESLLFGGWYYQANLSAGYGYYTQLGDTWQLPDSGGSWGPLALALAPSHPSGEVGVTLTIRAVGLLAPSGSTVAFHGLPAGCGSPAISSVRCVPLSVGTYSVSADVHTSLGLNGSAALQLHVVAPVSVSISGASSSTIVAGDLLTLRVAVAGGVGPYSFAYSGLPAGCSFVSNATLSCRPSTPGAYAISVRVSDAVGGSNLSTVTVELVPTDGRGGPPPASSFFGLGTLGSVVTGVVAGVGATLIVAWGIGRRRRRLSEEGSRLLEGVRRLAADGREWDRTAASTTSDGETPQGEPR